MLFACHAAALSQPAPVNVTAAISAHLDALRRDLRASPCAGCSSWFLRAHVRPWRAGYVAAEAARLHAHAARFGEFLPASRRPLRARDVPRYHDYWEADHSCAAESRMPGGIIGDGPKWLCGAALHPAPCRVVSLGSNFDDAFERGMHAAAGCSSYIVDPTLAREELPAFEARLRAYGARLNHTVGVGSGGRLRFRGGSAPLVGLDALLRDRYGAAPLHVSVLKVDIEGSEFSSLSALWAMCAEGALTVDQLNVEVTYPVTTMCTPRP